MDTKCDQCRKLFEARKLKQFAEFMFCAPCYRLNLEDAEFEGACEAAEARLQNSYQGDGQE